MRVVTVTGLMVLGSFGSHPHSLSDTDFENLFTKGKKIVVNYHDHPQDVARSVFGRKGVERMHIEGYREEGKYNYPIQYDVEESRVEVPRHWGSCEGGRTFE